MLNDGPDSEAEAQPIEVKAEDQTPPDVVGDDYTAEALRALTLLATHSEHQIAAMLQLGEAVAKAKARLKRGEFAPWCDKILHRKPRLVLRSPTPLRNARRPRTCTHMGQREWTSLVRMFLRRAPAQAHR